MGKSNNDCGTTAVEQVALNLVNRLIELELEKVETTGQFLYLYKRCLSVAKGEKQ
jgi:hypothetical protein